MSLPPSLVDIDRLARAALAALPDPFRELASEVALVIEDFPSEEVMREMGVETPFEITGLYEGIALTEKSVGHSPEQPDCIRLYRRPILDEWCDRGDIGLEALVSHVLVHELAHHFGWSDADIAAIDPWWE